MLGKLSMGAIYLKPTIYCVTVCSNNVRHDVKFIEKIANNHKAVKIMKIYGRRSHYTIYFHEQEDAKACARTIKKCHLYDKDFKFS